MQVYFKYFFYKKKGENYIFFGNILIVESASATVFGKMLNFVYSIKINSKTFA